MMSKRRYRIWRKVCALAVLMCLYSLLLSGCQKQAEVDSEEETLPVIVVGCDNYPPYSYTGTDGYPTGIDIDLATEAFSRMGYRAEFVTIDWENKKSLVESGEIDCIWSSFSINGREDQYLWAGPYMVSRQVAAVNIDSDITSLQDLEGKNVAVQTTTKPEELFLNNHTNPDIPGVGNLFSMQNRELIYPMLSKGYVDAVAAHETAILQYMSDYDVEYRILEEPLQVVGLGVAFSRYDNRGIGQQLANVLENMRTDGTSEQIIGKYLPDAGRFLEVENAGK